MIDRVIGKPQLRSFGLIVSAGFTVIALWPTVLRGEQPRTWALAAAFLLLAAVLTFPSALGPFHRVWMSAGDALAWFNTRIILSVVYYGLVVPIGAILRAAGNDPMRRKFDRKAETYRIPRAKRPASHMHRQY